MFGTLTHTSDGNRRFVGKKISKVLQAIDTRDASPLPRMDSVHATVRRLLSLLAYDANLWRLFPTVALPSLVSGQNGISMLKQAITLDKEANRLIEDRARTSKNMRVQMDFFVQNAIKITAPVVRTTDIRFVSNDGPYYSPQTGASIAFLRSLGSVELSQLPRVRLRQALALSIGLLLVHPLRNGNGRTSRFLLNMACSTSEGRYFPHSIFFLLAPGNELYRSRIHQMIGSRSAFEDHFGDGMRRIERFVAFMADFHFEHSTLDNANRYLDNLICAQEVKASKDELLGAVGYQDACRVALQIASGVY